MQFTYLIQGAAALSIFPLPLLVLEALRLAPLGPAVLEPDLRVGKIENSNEIEKVSEQIAIIWPHVYYYYLCHGASWGLVDCRASQWKIEKLSPHTDEIFHLRNFNNLLWQRHPEK